VLSTTLARRNVPHRVDDPNHLPCSQRLNSYRNIGSFVVAILRGPTRDDSASTLALQRINLLFQKKMKAMSRAQNSA
jgi:hypothetical protein